VRRRGDEGQATVELALSLPLIVTLAMLLLQVTLVVRDQVLVTNAARAAVREAAVSSDPAAARRAAADGSHLDPDRLDVEVRAGAARQSGHVVVRYASPTAVPLIGGLVGDVHLSPPPRCVWSPDVPCDVPMTAKESEGRPS